MKVCSSCKAQNLDDAAFCDNCGASLPPASAPAVAAPQPVAPVPVVAAQPTPPPQPIAPVAAPVGKIKCSSCGAENEVGDAFCQNCGTSLKPPAPPPPIVAQATPPVKAPPVAPVVPSAPPPPQSIQQQPSAPVAPPQAAPARPPASPAQQSMPSVQPAPQLSTPMVAPQPVAAGMLAAIPGTTPPIAGHPRLQVVSNMSYFDITGRSELLLGRVDPISGIFPEVDLTAHGGDEGGVSRRHCKLTHAGNQFFVEDLNSSNGTFVNAMQITPGQRVPIENGWQLRLGKVVLNFYTG